MPDPLGLADLFGRRHLRIGVTGLARAGKTAFLTSVAANLLAQGSGIPALPTLGARAPGRALRVSVAPAGADDVPRFDYPAHLAALAADPPRWPERTGAVSLLSLDLAIAREGLGSVLPDRSVRLDLLDYPGEWLLDLPLLGLDFGRWSAATLRRLESGVAAPFSRDFRSFVGGLPAQAPADETLAATGHRLFRDLLGRLRDEA
ncbi:MAG: YcjX family protein, partial [Acetobacteraceae bacterium]|nr:YcjX family protein [Acetobacteraceae bacterium]